MIVPRHPAPARRSRQRFSVRGPRRPGLVDRQRSESRRRKGPSGRRSGCSPRCSITRLPCRGRRLKFRWLSSASGCRPSRRRDRTCRDIRKPDRRTGRDRHLVLLPRGQRQSSTSAGKPGQATWFSGKLSRCPPSSASRRSPSVLRAGWAMCRNPRLKVLHSWSMAGKSCDSTWATGSSGPAPMAASCWCWRRCGIFPKTASASSI